MTTGQKACVGQSTKIHGPTNGKTNGKNNRTNVIPNGRHPVTVLESAVISEPAQGNGQSQKLGLADVLRDLHPNASVIPVLITALFNNVMTQRTQTDFFENTTALNSVVYNLNQRFRASHGTDAVLRESLLGSQGTGSGFWILRLNPEIFDVPADYKLKVGKDIVLEDIFSPAQVRIMRAIAARQFCTKQELLSAGITENELGMHISDHRLIGRKYEQVRDKLEGDFGYPVRRLKGTPFLYYVDRDFAKTFGVAIKRLRPPINTAFSQLQLKIIYELSCVAALRPSQLGKKLGFSNAVIHDNVKSINERCVALGLHPAIMSEGANKSNFVFRINPDFTEQVGLVPIERMDLAAHFTRDQLEIIRYLVANPFRLTRELGMAFPHLTRDAIAIRLRWIETKCKHLQESTGSTGSLLIKVGKPTVLWAFSREFYRMFGLEYPLINPVIVLRSEKQKQRYLYVKAHSNQTRTEAARALGISLFNLVNAISHINKRLVAGGFEPLPRKIRTQEDSGLRLLRSKLIKARFRTGRWHKESIEISSATRSSARLRKTVSRYRSPQDAMLAALHTMTDEEQARILEHELEWVGNHDFSEFKESSRAVRNACAGALQRGAELANIVGILDKGLGCAATLKLINAQTDELGLPQFEQDEPQGSSNLSMALGADGFDHDFYR